MKNPWLEIPVTEYEKHMDSVGQSKMISEILVNAVSKFQPQSIVILGASSGNGLEEMQENLNILAIDINQDYLFKLEKNYSEKFDNLKTLTFDLNNNLYLEMKYDLFFAALIFEYVEPLVSKIIHFSKFSSLIIDKTLTFSK
ncbi:MAG: hypothetical protein JXR48_13350 [Candidatus Delongbacteria bacterium]|nr:hypothetical protein [Candidatus Delongbacteria bacterium]MBN2835941.1 hypothetical protein [Candidatus Delongbacteria bacterium]